MEPASLAIHPRRYANPSRYGLRSLGLVLRCHRARDTAWPGSPSPTARCRASREQPRILGSTRELSHRLPCGRQPLPLGRRGAGLHPVTAARNQMGDQSQLEPRRPRTHPRAREPVHLLCLRLDHSATRPRRNRQLGTVAAARSRDRHPVAHHSRPGPSTDRNHRTTRRSSWPVRRDQGFRPDGSPPRLGPACRGCDPTRNHQPRRPRLLWTGRNRRHAVLRPRFQHLANPRPPGHQRPLDNGSPRSWLV